LHHLNTGDVHGNGECVSTVFVSKKTKCQLFLYKLVEFSIKYMAMYVDINTIHTYSKRL